MKTIIIMLVAICAYASSVLGADLSLIATNGAKQYRLGAEIKVQIIITNSSKTNFTLIDDQNALERNFAISGKNAVGQDVSLTEVVKRIRSEPLHGSVFMRDMAPNTGVHYEVDTGRYLNFKTAGTYKVVIARTGLLEGAGFLSVTSAPVEIRIE